MANRAVEDDLAMREGEAGPGFEDALAQLEGLVARLEAGGLPLAEAVAHYERGMGLAAYCGNLLDQAELRVRQIDAATLAGAADDGPFEADAAYDPEDGGAAYDMDREITRLLFDEE